MKGFIIHFLNTFTNKHNANIHNKSNIVVFVITILLLIYLEIPTNVLIIIIFVYFVYQKYIQDTDKKHDTIKKKKKYKKILKHHDRNLSKILDKLYKFKKYNKKSYKLGIKKYEQFLYYIDLFKKGVDNKKHIYDLAETSLTESLNDFISITVSLPAKASYKNGNKIRDLELDNRLKEIVDELDLYSIELLEYIGKQVNDEWKNNINNSCSPVDLPSFQLPQASNINDILYSENRSIY